MFLSVQVSARTAVAKRPRGHRPALSSRPLARYSHSFFGKINRKTVADVRQRAGCLTAGESGCRRSASGRRASMKSAIAVDVVERKTGRRLAVDRDGRRRSARMLGSLAESGARVLGVQPARLDLAMALALVAFDQHEVARRQPRQDVRRASARPRRAIRASAPSAGPTRSATSVAPAWRWRKLSAPSRSMSKSWCACLTVETRQPRRVSSVTSFSVSVVLPEFFQPVMPKTRAHRCNSPSSVSAARKVVGRVDVEERIERCAPASAIIGKLDRDGAAGVGEGGDLVVSLPSAGNRRAVRQRDRPQPDCRMAAAGRSGEHRHVRRCSAAAQQAARPGPREGTACRSAC